MRVAVRDPSPNTWHERSCEATMSSRCGMYRRPALSKLGEMKWRPDDWAIMLAVRKWLGIVCCRRWRRRYGEATSGIHMNIGDNEAEEPEGAKM